METFPTYFDAARWAKFAVLAGCCVCVTAGCARPRANPIEVTEHETLVTTDNFEAEVANASVPVLLDFSASWCPPCQEMAPILHRVAEGYEGRLKVGVVDTDNQASAELADSFGVNGIPAFFIVLDGQPVSGARGYISESRFREWIDKELAAAAAASDNAGSDTEPVREETADTEVSDTGL